MSANPRSKQKWRSNKPFPFEIQTSIPIYSCCWLLLSLSTDLKKARVKHKEFGKYEETDGALAARDDKGRFGIFFTTDYLHKGVIAHEIFHVTHHIMDYIEQEFDIDNHEPHAYLNHWITDWVYEQIERRGIKIDSWSPDPALIRLAKKNGNSKPRRSNKTSQHRRTKTARDKS